ncbi:MAG: cupin domain-containing protein [Bacteroidia bacterium]
MITITIQKLFVTADDVFPNSELPVLFYKGAVHIQGTEGAEVLEKLFEANNWKNSWRNGIYGYHHYHSITHEVLGVYKGKAKVQLGGEQGITIEVHKGDVIIIPAGVAHKNVGSSFDFKCVGAYPEGKEYDIKTGKKEERTQADENIKAVGLPGADPLYGAEGPLLNSWKK